MSYKTYRLCLFIIFLVFKNGLATNNHIGLLIVCLIIKIFPFYFKTRICYLFYVLNRHHNLLVITHCKLMTIEPQFFSPPKTLKYWVGVQWGQSYLMGRRCLFSLGWVDVLHGPASHPIFSYWVG